MRLKAMKRMLICIYIVFSITGCTKSSESNSENTSFPQVKSTFFSDANAYSVSECRALNDLPQEVRENEWQHVDPWVNDGKVGLILQSFDENNMFLMNTKKIYSYDLDADSLTLMKTFDQPLWVVSFAQWDDRLMYAYLKNDTEIPSLFKLTVVEEKGDTSTVITSARIANPSEYRPFFVVQGDSVYFMLNDYIPNDPKDVMNATMRFQFMKYEQGKLETLYQTEAIVKDGVYVFEGGFIGTNKVYAQATGGIMFQVLYPTYSELRYLKDGEIKAFKLDSPEEILRGYLGNYAVIYIKPSKTYTLVNLATGERSPIDFDEPIYDAKIINDTMMYFMGSNYQTRWIMSLQENGQVRITSFDEIFNKLNIDKTENSRVFFLTDGKDIFIELTDINLETYDTMFKGDYRIQYKHDTSQ